MNAATNILAKQAFASGFVVRFRPNVDSMSGGGHLLQQHHNISRTEERLLRDSSDSQERRSAHDVRIVPQICSGRWSCGMQLPLGTPSWRLQISSIMAFSCLLRVQVSHSLAGY
ncbi:hypothetical protein PMIN01_05532 [Paraphaeosphaeria minitans]|uniref:Uncharacterized protein n=1 Tax=Paraphaeosphaeria minitans TaxID=565426 RepID=A0A9P6KSE9_9PLEO|nr:hypothetical protein PMIN01_05532 [Paraphaeosphaeria minitans]